MWLHDGGAMAYFELGNVKRDLCLIVVLASRLLWQGRRGERYRGRDNGCGSRVFSGVPMGFPRVVCWCEVGAAAVGSRWQQWHALGGLFGELQWSQPYIVSLRSSLSQSKLCYPFRGLLSTWHGPSCVSMHPIRCGVGLLSSATKAVSLLMEMGWRRRLLGEKCSWWCQCATLIRPSS